MGTGLLPVYTQEMSNAATLVNSFRLSYPILSYLVGRWLLFPGPCWNSSDTFKRVHVSSLQSMHNLSAKPPGDPLMLGILISGV